MLGIIVLRLSTMVTCKETRALNALHKKGFTGKDIEDRLLKLIQLRDQDTTSTELAQEWQQVGVSASVD